MSTASSLPPFPDGWFFICLSRNLKPGQLLSKTFMGTEIVAFRDPEGKAVVLDAICPHLGAHMGKGGCVQRGTLECPFHKFRFDGKGQCVFVPGAPPPRRAKVKSWPVQEVNGLVLAFHDAEGREPSWFIPELDEDGWSDFAHHHYYIVGHPQETTENGVDSVHLATIHGYEAIETLKKPEIDGPHLTSTLRMQRGSRGIFEPLNLKLDVVFDVHVWGLGWSTVDISVPRVGLKGRLWTLASPSDGKHIHLDIALKVKHLEKPAGLPAGLSRVPTDWLRPVVLRLAKLAYRHDIEQDFFIWENKRFVARPQLARNDGPVSAYRRYCRQFYPELRKASGVEAAE